MIIIDSTMVVAVVVVMTVVFMIIGVAEIVSMVVRMPVVLVCTARQHHESHESNPYQ